MVYIVKGRDEDADNEWNVCYYRVESQATAHAARANAWSRQHSGVNPFDPCHMIGQPWYAVEGVQEGRQ